MTLSKKKQREIKIRKVSLILELMILTFLYVAGITVAYVICSANMSNGIIEIDINRYGEALIEMGILVVFTIVIAMHNVLMIQERWNKSYHSKR